MRHFRSILYALVLAPAVWVLAGVGLTRDLTTRGRDEFAVESITGLALLVLAGAAYAILVFAPISPAGPTLAGLAYLGVAIWALRAPSAYADIWPAGVTKEGFDLSRPGYGLATLLAVPLIGTALSARRWKRYEPPVLPLVGQIGRARGAAPVAGMPNEAARTTLLPGRRTDPDPTTVMRLPPPDDTPTVVTSSASDTTAIRTTDNDTVAFTNDPTVTVDNDDTATVVTAEPTSAPPSPTSPSATSSPDASGREPTEVVADSAETAVISESGAESATEEAELNGAKAGSDGGPPGLEAAGSDDEPTEPVVTPPTPPVDDETTGNLDAPDPDTTRPIPLRRAVPALERLDDEAEPTLTLRVAHQPDDDDEPTRTLRVAQQPDGDDEPTRTLWAVDSDPTADLGDSDAESTRVIRLPVGDQAERTQVVRIPQATGPTVYRPGEQTRVIPFPRTGDVGGDETQIIRLPVRSNDGENTQVIRPGLVEPPPERTEVIRLPVRTPENPRGRENTEVGEASGRTGKAAEGAQQADAEHDAATRQPSIVEAEAPDIADDPTSRLEPSPPRTDDAKRPMTVMKMERPPEN